MRIGVDACCWSNKRGFGRFTRELLSELTELDRENDYWFFVDQDNAPIVLGDNVNVITVPTHVPPTQAASSSGRRSVRDVWAMSRQVLKQNLDLFFFPAVYSYFPVLNHLKTVVTIHDMIPDRHPEAVFPNNKLRRFWRMKQSLAVLQSQLIVTVSEHAKSEIVRYCRVPESRVTVISEGPSAVFRALPRDVEMARILEQHQIEGNRFLLYVGGLSPHKNLGTLLAVFQQLRSEQGYADIKLVLVGDYTGDSFYSDYPALKQQVDQAHLEQSVVFAGFVDDADLAYLYNAASFLVLPSLLEGFGLPAVEAMACGTPVAASRVGPLPEILGDAGRLFDPTDPTEMLEVTKYLLDHDEVRGEMGACGLTRSKQFTWEKGATELLTAFESLTKE